MRLLLVGNYGVGNLGDEALREYFLKRFPEVQGEVEGGAYGDEEEGGDVEEEVGEYDL